jgi:hypothetical protein
MISERKGKRDRKRARQEYKYGEGELREWREPGRSKYRGVCSSHSLLSCQPSVDHRDLHDDMEPVLDMVYDCGSTILEAPTL